VAHFGWRLNHIKLLKLSWLQNQCFFLISTYWGCGPAPPPPTPLGKTLMLCCVYLNWGHSRKCTRTFLSLLHCSRHLRWHLGYRALRRQWTPYVEGMSWGKGRALREGVCRQVSICVEWRGGTQRCKNNYVFSVAVKFSDFCKILFTDLDLFVFTAVLLRSHVSWGGWFLTFREGSQSVHVERSSSSDMTSYPRSQA
jgi:hypothetical protein